MSNWLPSRPPERHSVIESAPRDPVIGLRLWEDRRGPVLAYAGLCTRDRAAAVELADQVVRFGGCAPRGDRSWLDGLPSVPVAVQTVLDTAAGWAATPAGQRLLAPDLLTWFDTEGADRGGWADPQPLAVRGLRAMGADDAELLWWSGVEGVPVDELARRLGRRSVEVATEVDRVREEFRERCRLAHGLHLADPVCRSYAGLLDATARESAPSTPVGLLQHLDTCAECRTAFTCLSLDGAPLSPVIAAAALRWKGRTYVARRRRQLAAAPTVAVPSPSPVPAGRRRAGAPVDRGDRPLLVAGTAVALVLVVTGACVWCDSPRDGGSTPKAGVGAEFHGGGLTASPSADPSGPERPGHGPGRETGRGSSVRPAGDNTPVPAGDDSARPAPPPPADAVCRALFGVRDPWADPVEAALVLRAGRALEGGWSVTFVLARGVEIHGVRGGRAVRDGRVVRVTAGPDAAAVAADAALDLGLALSGSPDGGWLSGVRVDGRPCSLTTTTPPQTEEPPRGGGDGGREGDDDGDGEGRGGEDGRGSGSGHGSGSGEGHGDGGRGGGDGGGGGGRDGGDGGDGRGGGDGGGGGGGGGGGW
ncbi:hypothetical protein ELQ87_38575 [Streptomyces griseoviridis]|uniref:Cellulose-binding protein n=1 Tax=Streptomyces griseoviridis TaxID=45398 RepID=A0A3Q9KUE2_STRGD|nr:hypothetical protein [Streptomyces griseoviridis]AZS89501.1 hypothetical protein ELQ87_38575 [Streptomyces griseoviridis]QCN83659.1 hypothetical protein DDJ31_00660 [Streptomyces griseoviridis]